MYADQTDSKDSEIRKKNKHHKRDSILWSSAMVIEEDHDSDREDKVGLLELQRRVKGKRTDRLASRVSSRTWYFRFCSRKREINQVEEGSQLAICVRNKDKQVHKVTGKTGGNGKKEAIDMGTK